MTAVDWICMPFWIAGIGFSLATIYEIFKWRKS